MTVINFRVAEEQSVCKQLHNCYLLRNKLYKPVSHTESSQSDNLSATQSEVSESSHKAVNQSVSQSVRKSLTFASPCIITQFI